MIKGITILRVIVGVAVGLSLTSEVMAGPLFAVTDMGVLLGGHFSGATGINNLGQVVGVSTSSAGAGERGFLWDSMNGMQVLSGLPDSHGFAHASSINNLSQVAGLSRGSPDIRATRWDAINTPIDLGILPTHEPDGYSAGHAINDVGQVAGSSFSHGGFPRAVLWDPVDGIMDLGTRPANAYGINNSGAVVGESRTPDDVVHAFLWSAATGIQDLGDLPGGRDHSVAFDINNLGQVVGQSDTVTTAAPNTTPGTHAFIWDNTSGMVDLGTLPGFTDRSEARAINNLGQVVGDSRKDTGDSRTRVRAFLWDPIEGMLNLNDLLFPGSGWILESALDINDSGQIVGVGFNGTELHGFLLTPCEPATCSHIPDPDPEPAPPPGQVPEPSTWLLLATGCLGLLALGWWRRQRAV